MIIVNLILKVKIEVEMVLLVKLLIIQCSKLDG